MVLAVFGAGMVMPIGKANAILLKANNNEFANVGLKLAIWAQNNGKVTTNDQNSTNFSIENARIYFVGQINPIVQFGANLDFADNNALAPDGSARAHGGMPSTLIKDAFINFKFMPQAQLMAGLFVDPWSRVALGDLYSFIVPLENYNPGISEINVDGGKLLGPNSINYITSSSGNIFKPFMNPTIPFTFGSDVGNAYRDAGLTLWGDIGKDAMIKYYLMVGNGKYDYEAGQNGKGNLKYGFRIEFTPTMLGYKGTPGFVDEDTFYGHQNTLTLGIAYQQQKIECGTNATTGASLCPAGLSSANSSTTAKAFTVDAFWEQKFGDFVPNLQAAWLDQKDLGYAKAGTNIAQPEAQGYYIQTQLLYDRYVGIGKPALVLRYEEDENKNYYVNPSNTNSFVTGKVSTTDIFVNYYIADENANISLGAQIVSPNSDLKNATANGGNQLKTFTDYTLAIRTMF